MQCLCSADSPARPFQLLVPKHATPSYNLGASSSVSLPPQRRPPQSLLNDDVGELGHTLLATVQSSKQRKQEAQISGSDVLWALQRAGARKMKKNKQKQEQEQRRVSSSAGTPRNRMEEIAVNYSDVRPLSINPNWATKLDDLEKRLLELSHTIE